METEAQRATRKNAELAAELVTAKAGRGYVAVHAGGTKIHAATGIVKGHSGYNHPRPLCMSATSLSYGSLTSDPHTTEVTCKRCLASPKLAKAVAGSAKTEYASHNTTGQEAKEDSMAVKGATATKARTKAERDAKKAKTAAKPKATSTKRADSRANDKAQMEKVVSLRADGKSWGEIGKALSITAGKAAFLHLVSEVKPKDKIKANNDSELAAHAIKLRLEGLSWGVIAARAYHLNVPEPRLKALAQKHATAAQKRELGKNVASKRAAAKPKTSASTTRSQTRTSGKKGATTGSRRRPSK